MGYQTKPVNMPVQIACCWHPQSCRRCVSVKSCLPALISFPCWDIAVTLKSVICLASCAPSETIVTQKAFYVIDVYAWLIIKSYHHFYCHDHSYRRKSRVLCCLVSLFLISVIIAGNVCFWCRCKEHLNCQALSQWIWTAVSGSVPMQRACRNSD